MSSNRDLIKAHLNLYAILQNLEDLTRLDETARNLIQNLHVQIQFKVKGGPEAWLEFTEGTCTHGRGKHPNPTIKLFFLSPHHLNAMFEGKSTPIPLKGFSKLGILKNEFSQLTDRMAYFLRPTPEREAEPDYQRINTVLTLNTVLFAVRELASLEPTCKKIALATPSGGVAISVLPEGPRGYLRFTGNGMEVGKGALSDAQASMTFQDIEAAHNILTGKIDTFRAVAEQKLFLKGKIPLLDNAGLIMDRVEGFLQ